MIKALIDSNILVYLFDVSDPKKHAIADKVIGELIEGNTGIISVQNLAEFCRSIERSKQTVPYTQTSLYVQQFINIFEIIDYNSKTILKALQIASTYNIHFFDALLVATIEENHITEIITENEKDFSKIPWLTVINPFKRKS